MLSPMEDYGTMEEDEGTATIDACADSFTNAGTDVGVAMTDVAAFNPDMPSFDLEAQ